MIRVYILIALYVLIPVGIIECFKRWGWMHKIGTVVAAYAIGILFALTGLVHFEPGTAAALSFSKLQSTLMSVTVPLAIPLMLFTPAYLLEDIPLLSALSKSLRLGFSTWWGTFALMLVLGFIVSFLQGIFSIPYYIMVVVKTILGMQGNGSEFFDSVGYSFTVYLFGVLQSYATFLLMTIVFVGLALQYGHAAEKIDHVTMEDNINRFEEL